MRLRSRVLPASPSALTSSSPRRPSLQGELCTFGGVAHNSRREDQASRDEDTEAQLADSCNATRRSQGPAGTELRSHADGPPGPIGDGHTELYRRGCRVFDLHRPRGDLSMRSTQHSRCGLRLDHRRPSRLLDDKYLIDLHRACSAMSGRGPQRAEHRGRPSARSRRQCACSSAMPGRGHGTYVLHGELAVRFHHRLVAGFIPNGNGRHGPNRRQLPDRGTRRHAVQCGEQVGDFETDELRRASRKHFSASRRGRDVRPRCVRLGLERSRDCRAQVNPAGLT